MNQQGIRSDGAVCIRCHDYCVLVVDHHIPEECKTDKFLSDLDTIILLRWTKWNAACVSQFLNEIINRRIPSIAGVPSSNATSIHSRLCCLILPGFTYKGNYTLSVTEPQSGHPTHKDDTDATFRLAMELGVHVLQLHESTNSLSFGLHIRGSSNYQSALRTNNTKHEGSSVSRHGGKYTHEKNVGMVLYQKYGVGCLQLVPMFETQSDDSCGFSALFRWMPHRASWPDEERASQCMVCCTQEILQTTTNLAVNHAPKDSQEPLSVLKSVRKLQLLMENLMLICDEIHSNENTSKTSPTNKPSFRSGLTKSQAFVTALKQNGSLSKPYARRVVEPKNKRCTVSPSIPFFGTTSVKTTPPEETDNPMTDHTKLEVKQDTGSTGSWYRKHSCSPTLMNHGMEAERCPLNGNASSNLSPFVVDCDTELGGVTNTKIHKSISYPVSLDWNAYECLRPASSLSNATGSGSVLCCATVLLAIPEVGESDYYPESPQCLTVDDLRKLGVYDDEDDEDDEDGDIDKDG